jgi:acyl-CoA thioesterase FadM
VSQSIRFLAPVRIGDTVIARAQVAELVTDKRRVRMTTICTVGDTKVLDGEAVLMVPSRPNGAGQIASIRPPARRPPAPSERDDPIRRC